MYQQTIRPSFTLDGTSIHSGYASNITLHPAEPDTGSEGLMLYHFTAGGN